MIFSNRMAAGLLISSAASYHTPPLQADFTVPITVMTDKIPLDAACKRQKQEMAIDLEKATALILWTAFCRPDVVKNQLIKEQLYTFGPDGAIDENGLPIPQSELILSFLYFFTHEADFVDNLPGEKFPLSVREIPLLTYNTNAAAGQTTVWTGSPNQMPIAQLLSEPASLAMYCESSAAAPANFEPSFSMCLVDENQIATGASIKLPSIPPIPSIKGQDPKRLAECHKRRIAAARSGEISHQELFDLTKENSVPVFKIENDEKSSVIGFEPCVEKHKELGNARQEGLRDSVKAIDTIQVHIKGRQINLSSLEKLNQQGKGKGKSGYSPAQQWLPSEDQVQQQMTRHPGQQMGQDAAQQ